VIPNPVTLTECSSSIISTVETITPTIIIGINIAVSTPNPPLTFPASYTPSSTSPTLAAPKKLETAPSPTAAPTSVTVQVVTSLGVSQSSPTASRDNGIGGAIYSMGGFGANAHASSTSTPVATFSVELNRTATATATATGSNAMSSPLLYVQGSGTGRNALGFWVWGIVRGSIAISLFISFL